MAADPVVDGLVAALLAFASTRGHWPSCPQTTGRFTSEDRHGDIIVTPCSKKCRKAREAIEAAGVHVEQPTPRVRGQNDKRTLADLFAHRSGCSLIPGSEYHHDGCRHGGTDARR